MGVRGELFSARVRSNNDRRTYFFNVKENRNRDLFLTIVESKKLDNGEEHERHQVVVFDEDFHLFAKGFERVMEFVHEHHENREPRGNRRERPAEERPRDNRNKRPGEHRPRDDRRR